MFIFIGKVCYFLFNGIIYLFVDGELRFKPPASEVAQTTLSKASHFLQTPSWRGGHPATPTSCLPPTPPQCQHDRRTMPPTIFQHKTAYRQNSFYRTRTIAEWNCLPGAGGGDGDIHILDISLSLPPPPPPRAVCHLEMILVVGWLSIALRPQKP